MVHKGFYGAFQRVLPGIKAAVEEAAREGTKNIVVTGHSLGELLRLG